MQNTDIKTGYNLTRFDSSSDAITFTYTDQNLGSIVKLEISSDPGACAIVLEKDGRISALMIDNIIDFIYHNGDIIN